MARPAAPGQTRVSLTSQSRPSQFGQVRARTKLEQGQGRIVPYNLQGQGPQLVPEAVKLVRLHSVVPATSCTTERSFSQLRRLKNWLRTTMSQTRLNHAAVCAVHAEVLMEMDLKPLMREFAMRSGQRVFVNVFGKL